MFNERIQKLYDYMDQLSLDAMLITLPKHIFYFAGVVMEPHERFIALVLQNQEDPFLIVPHLDLESVKGASSVERVVGYKDTDNPFLILKEYLSLIADVQRLGIEKNHLTVRRYESLTATLGIDQFIDIEGPLQRMRAVKSPEEIVRIKTAVQLIEDILKQTLDKVKVGVSELDIATELEFLMRKAGVEPAFNTTVLSGEKSALPHGISGKRTIQHGELLLFDIGVQVDGYLSDITRTFAVGDIHRDLKQIYEVVLEANVRTIEAVRPGISCADLDAIARNYIEKEGFGSHFTHRIGHGLGIEIHEYPSIHGNNHDLLLEGMVITVEPGIYIPNLGGVRIEDDVLVTSTGVEVLTSFPKQLTIIDL